jgi:hypothetical protein
VSKFDFVSLCDVIFGSPMVGKSLYENNGTHLGWTKCIAIGKKKKM